MGDWLFTSGGPLSDYLLELEQVAMRFVDDMDDFDLLDKAEDAHVRALVESLLPRVPVLLVERATMKVIEGPEAHPVQFVVPFDGTAGLFSLAPDGATEEPPEGKALGALFLTISAATPTEAQKAFLGRTVAIERWLDLTRAQLLPVKARLARTLERRLTERRKRLIADLNVDVESYEALSGSQIPQITIEDLKSLVLGGAPFRLLGVLRPEQWERAHLPRSECVDYSSLARQSKGFGKDERLIVYCTGAG